MSSSVFQIFRKPGFSNSLTVEYFVDFNRQSCCAVVFWLVQCNLTIFLTSLPSLMGNFEVVNSNGVEVKHTLMDVLLRYKLQLKMCVYLSVSSQILYIFMRLFGFHLQSS